jgi:Trk K+ transport system NAD-binding subunit
MRIPAPPSHRRAHFVVCGDDPLAHRIVEELTGRYNADVTVILVSRRRNHGPQISRLPRVRIVEADRLDADAFRAARLETAAALALAQQDDVGNLHAALRAQEVNPGLRMVIRMFNMNLGHAVRQLVADCAVLSDAAIASPVFVAAALGEVAPSYVQLPGRTLYVAHRSDVPPNAVVCGLADTSNPGQPDLLPIDQDRADLVLAVADGSPRDLPAPEPSATAARRRFRDGPLVKTGRAMLSLINRKLRLAALALVAVLLAGTAVLAAFEQESAGWWRAFYVTLLTAVGGAQAEPGKPIAVQVVEVVVTLAGIALVPVITAAVVEAVVNARITLAYELHARATNHVVVVGLGNVGTRVIRQLHNLGVKVVAIDKSATARGAQLARQLGIPLIVDDASREETLRAAHVQDCRALVCLSTDDVTNLEAALYGRGLQRQLRVVLRLFDGDLADRLQTAFEIDISRSVSYLAAPAFTLALFERDVIGTIPVERHVLLVGEVPVGAGSRLDGAPVAAVHDVGEVWVIAVTGGRWPDATWSPSLQRRLAPHDRLIVVATRDGLSRVLAWAAQAPAEDYPATDR